MFGVETAMPNHRPSHCGRRQINAGPTPNLPQAGHISALWGVLLWHAITITIKIAQNGFPEACSTSREMEHRPRAVLVCLLGLTIVDVVMWQRTSEFMLLSRSLTALRQVNVTAQSRSHPRLMTRDSSAQKNTAISLALCDERSLYHGTKY